LTNSIIFQDGHIAPPTSSYIRTYGGYSHSYTPMATRQVVTLSGGQ
jgi:hypothetical protein